MKDANTASLHQLYSLGSEKNASSFVLLSGLKASPLPTSKNRELDRENKKFMKPTG